MKKKLVILVLILSTLCLAFITTAPFVTAPKKIINIQANWTQQKESIEELKQVAANIYIGTVISSRVIDDGDVPLTLYKLSSSVPPIKGSFDYEKEEVLISGGERDGVLYLFDNQPLLEVGETYLFFSDPYTVMENTEVLVGGYQGVFAVNDEPKKMNGSSLAGDKVLNKKLREEGKIEIKEFNKDNKIEKSLLKMNSEIPLNE